ncbi:MAG: FHA domain-containing protein [Bauldia litoralis]
MSSLPPWLVPALIVHVALALVLLWPTWRAFARARTGGAWSLVLVVPVLGLIAVAVLLGTSVLRRAGWSPAWSPAAVIPLVNVVFLWLFAYGRWTRSAAVPVEEPQTARRAEPRIAAASAREPAPAAEPTLSRPTDDGYEALDPHNRGFVEEVDAPPEVGDIELGEQTMIAGAPGPKQDPEPVPPEPVPPKAEEAPPESPPRKAATPDAPPAKEPPPDEMTLAAGVLSDLDAVDAPKPDAESPRPDTEPPKARGPGDEERTVPVRHDPAPAGDRVWTLRGVNARAANIEVTIREADLSQSATGILVGRSNRVDFIIADESVSRNHARFVYQDGSLCVEDLDSMNGTWVNGEPLDSNRPVPVADKGEVEFGKIKLLVSEE